MTFLLLGVLLLCSGVVSGSETAVFSLKPGERRRLAASNPIVAKVLARPGRLLVTLLLANLFINVAYFSVSAVMSLDLLEAGQPVLSVLVSLGAIVGLVIAGEIVPKTMALVSPATAVRQAAPILVTLRLVLSPLALLAEAATRFLDALVLGRREAAEMGAADFKSAIAGQSALGTYHAVELALLHDVVDFGQRRARNLMVPRVDVAYLDADAPREELVAAMAERPFRVYPVCRGSRDEILGTVQAMRVLSERDTPLTEMLDPPLFAPLSIAAEELVESMRRAQAPLALLLDEYGGLAGVVGFSTLTQSVLGEIDPTTGPSARPITQRHGDSLLVRGDCPLHQVEDEAGLVLPTRRADTMAGALAEALGRVPRVGDELRLPGWRLRVTAMVGRRVGAVLVRPSPEDRDDEDEEEDDDVPEAPPVERGPEGADGDVGDDGRDGGRDGGREGRP